MNATFTKVTEAQKMGNYTITSVDLNKKSVDFTIESMNPIFISFNDNSFSGIISKSELKRLQSKHTWKTNF